jgi:hypothetical protein
VIDRPLRARTPETYERSTDIFCIIKLFILTSEIFLQYVYMLRVPDVNAPTEYSQNVRKYTRPGVSNLKTIPPQFTHIHQMPRTEFNSLSMIGDGYLKPPPPLTPPTHV